MFKVLLYVIWILVIHSHQESDFYHQWAGIKIVFLALDTGLQLLIPKELIIKTYHDSSVTVRSSAQRD